MTEMGPLRALTDKPFAVGDAGCPAPPTQSRAGRNGPIRCLSSRVDLNADGHPEIIFTSWPKRPRVGSGSSTCSTISATSSIESTFAPPLSATHGTVRPGLEALLQGTRGANLDVLVPRGLLCLGEYRPRFRRDRSFSVLSPSPRSACLIPPGVRRSSVRP
jgi:hypothetical protein